MINRIACFGVGGKATRVYWLGTHVMETGFGSNGQWYTADLNQAALSSDVPVYNSSIACWAVHGELSRVYYFDLYRRLMELSFYTEINNWVFSSLTIDQHAPLAASGSSITCFGLNNDVARVYYFDSNDSIIELAEVGADHWQVNNLSSIAHAPATGPARVLTCFGVNRRASRVYYFDQRGHVIELGWGDNNQWYAGDISAACGAPTASGVSSIACFGVNGWATRVYYFDQRHHVIELGWGDNNQWYASDLSAACGAPAAFTPSGLTCFGVGTYASRIYYFDNNMNLIELGWGDNQQWYWGPIPGAPKANGPLTCFGVDGQLTRVYYQAGSPTRLYEVAFIDAGWHTFTIG